MAVLRREVTAHHLHELGRGSVGIDRSMAQNDALGIALHNQAKSLISPAVLACALSLLEGPYPASRGCKVHHETLNKSKNQTSPKIPADVIPGALTVVPDVYMMVAVSLAAGGTSGSDEARPLSRTAEYATSSTPEGGTRGSSRMQVFDAPLVVSQNTRIAPHQDVKIRHRDCRRKAGFSTP